MPNPRLEISKPIRFWIVANLVCQTVLPEHEAAMNPSFTARCHERHAAATSFGNCKQQQFLTSTKQRVA
eukprot:1658480-Amphidinium_carterae.3